MTRLVLVRHGDAAAGWADDLDPGLSDLGQQQAREVATRLALHPARPIVCSPMRRCVETAGPLARAWSVIPTVDSRVGEIESPGHDLTTRGPWLADILGRRWSEVEARLHGWRDGVVDALLRIDHDTVVFTHFVAINVAIGAATGDDRVVCRRVANCSTTWIEHDGETLTLTEAPAEADRTEVL